MRRRAPLAAAFLLASTCLAAGAAQAKNGDLVIGVAQFPSTLNPNIDAEVIKAYVDDFAVRPVTAFDPQWKDSCLLCTTLPSLQNGLAKVVKNPDGSEGMDVTYTLKPDLKWGDGVPVTTKDLVFTWKLGSDPSNGFSNADPWSRISAIDVKDDHTAVLHFGKVDYTYNRIDQLLPEHIEGPIYAAAKSPGAYINSTDYAAKPTTPGLWNGPYMVTDYQSGAQITLSPNPYWAGTKPGFQHVVIKLIGNTAALQANLLAGDIDMVAGEGIGLTIDQAIALQKQHPKAFTYIFKPSLTYEMLAFQTGNPILADLRIRQALLYAANRQEITQKLFSGLQPVANTWVNPLDPDYDKTVQTYPYDPVRAKSLIAAAGWKPGSGGICRNDKGEPLQFQIDTTAGNRLRELTEQVLQSEGRAVCVDLVIKNEPARTLFGTTLKQRTYPGLVEFAWSSAVDENPYRTLDTASIPTKANGYGGANYFDYSNKQMDQDIATLTGTLDAGKQRALWDDMQALYAKTLPALPLYFRSEPHVIPTWLQGYTPTGTGDMSPLWAENWHAAAGP